MFLIFGIISCNDDNQLEPDFISAKINEKNWNGIPELNVNNVNDTLTLLGSGNEQVVFLKLNIMEKVFIIYRGVKLTIIQLLVEM